jgi:hypothetical protein
MPPRFARRSLGCSPSVPPTPSPQRCRRSLSVGRARTPSWPPRSISTPIPPRAGPRLRRSSRRCGAPTIKRNTGIPYRVHGGNTGRHAARRRPADRSVSRPECQPADCLAAPVRLDAHRHLSARCARRRSRYAARPDAEACHPSRPSIVAPTQSSHGSHAAPSEQFQMLATPSIAASCSPRWLKRDRVVGAPAPCRRGCERRRDRRSAGWLRLQLLRSSGACVTALTVRCPSRPKNVPPIA